MKPLRIAIVGCGIGGAAAAALLSERGHTVTVLERMLTLQPVGAGLMLQPSGQAVLRQMDVLAQIAQESEPLDRIVARTPTGRTVIDLHYREHAPETRGSASIAVSCIRRWLGKRSNTRRPSHSEGRSNRLTTESLSMGVAQGPSASTWSSRQTV